MRRILALLILLAIPAVAQFGGPMGGMRPGSMQGGGLLPGRGGDPLWVAAGPTKPTLDFDFAKRKDLTDAVSGKTSLVNFSRSAAQSPGTYVGADGLIHDAAVNLALYSEQFDNAYWTKSGTTVEANQAIAPDRKQTADRLTPSASNALHYIWRGADITSANISNYSVYVKADGYSKIALRESKSYGSYASFDLSTGTVLDAAPASIGKLEGYGIENVGDGWYRIYANFGDITLHRWGLWALPPSYTSGQPASSWLANGTDGYLIWGAQLEETDAATMQPTAYIKTTSQALAAPRFDHVPTTGNLTTNLVTYSEMLDVSGTWKTISASVTANAGTSPVGDQTADLVSLTNQVYQNTPTKAGTYTFSIYARSDTGTEKFRLKSYSATDGNVYSADETAATEWQRFTHTFTWTGTGGNIAIHNPSTGGTNNIYFYGAQLEASPTPGPYVRTLSETRSISDANAESLGLLVEEARANLLQRSEEFDLVWGSNNVTEDTNVAVAPDGTMTADKIKPNTANTAAHYITQTVSADGTFTVYAKAGEYDKIMLWNPGGADRGRGFDLTNGTTFNTGLPDAPIYSITDVGNGWYRCSIYNTGIAAAQVYIFASTSYSSYQGNDSDGVYLWGAQLESGATFPTSYIPTVTSQYRYADVAAVQDEDFSTTNLLAYSESFDVAWNPTGLEPIVANDAVSPDGQTTADKIIPTAAGGAHDVNQYPSVVSGTKYALTVYAKPAGFNYISLFNQHSGTGFGTVVFDVQNGTVTAAANGASTSQASISSVGNGWFRAVYMFTATATSASSYTGINVRPDGGSGAFVGNGTDGAYLWGASLTATEYPVAYTTTRNLLTDSQDFERWTTAQEFSDSGVNAPDGTPTASTISRISGGPAGTITNGNFTIGAIGEKVVLSVYAKHQDATVKTLNIVPDNTGAGGYPLTGGYAFSTFDLENGTVVSSGAGLTSSIVDVGNGWYRCSVAATAVSTGTYTPGFEAPFGASVAIWGAQLEPGTATDYVRTVDAVGKSYGWYEPTEGTVFVEFNIDQPLIGYDIIWNIDGGGTSSRMVGYRNNVNNQILLYSIAGGGSVNSGVSVASGDFAKSAFAVSPTASSIAVNGTSATGTSTKSTNGATQLLFARESSPGSASERIYFKRLTYWPRRQADSTLQVITQ